MTHGEESGQPRLSRGILTLLRILHAISLVQLLIRPFIPSVPKLSLFQGGYQGRGSGAAAQGSTIMERKNEYFVLIKIIFRARQILSYGGKSKFNKGRNFLKFVISVTFNRGAIPFLL